MEVNNGAPVTTPAVASKTNYAGSIARIGAGVGSISGIIYTVRSKSGFWKGVGWYFLGGIIGAGIGYGIGSMIDENKKA